MGLKDWLSGGQKAGSKGGAQRAPTGGGDPQALLEQITQLRRMGRLEDARQQLAQALRSHGNHQDLLRTHWDICVQLDRPEDGIRSIQRCIQLELRGGDGPAAIFHWFELLERVAEPPSIDLDTRIRLAEAMLQDEQGQEAAELLEPGAESLDPALPLGILIRLAKAALAARSPSAVQIAQAVLQRPGLPPGIGDEIRELVRQAQSQGLRTPAEEAQDDAPIELAAGRPAVRKLRVIPAIPLAVDADQISLDLGAQGRRKMALAQVQGLAAVRIDDGLEPAWVLIDLLLDSLWSDKELIRTVRLRTRDFDPMPLVPQAEDFQSALVTLLSNLLAVTQAHALPDAEAAVGRPFHGFASVREYEVRVLEVS